MTKKQMFLSFLLLLAPTTNIFTLTTVAECLESPEIIESQPELQSPEKIKYFRTFMSGFDAAYKIMDEKFGNQETHKLEEMLEGFIFQFLVDAKSAITNQECLEQISIVLDMLVKNAQQTHNVSTKEAVEFAIAVWTIRSITAGLKAATQGENNEESKLNQQKTCKHIQNLFQSFLSKYNVKMPQQKTV